MANVDVVKIVVEGLVETEGVVGFAFFVLVGVLVVANARSCSVPACLTR